MPFGQSDTFEVAPLPDGWGNPFQRPQAAAPMAHQLPAYHDDVNKKKQYGVALANRNNQAMAGFLAGCDVFEDTSAALWVSREWINDPIVLEAREQRLKTVEVERGTLDREQFAARLLSLSEEKNLAGTHYTFDDKERVNLLKLYAEVKGFTGKASDGATITNNTLVQGLTIKLVKPEEKEEPKTLNVPNSNPQNSNTNGLPLKLKLVS